MSRMILVGSLVIVIAVAGFIIGNYYLSYDHDLEISLRLTDEEVKGFVLPLTQGSGSDKSE